MFYIINFQVRCFIFIYSITFLLIGDILFSTIHYLAEHNHSDDSLECLECDFYEGNSNYYCENKLISCNNTSALFLLVDVDSIESTIYKYFHSRAPPLS